MPIRMKRIYAPAEAEDGKRVLVDRLWPRGVSKLEAKIGNAMEGVADEDYNEDIRKVVETVLSRASKHTRWYSTHGVERLCECTKRHQVLRSISVRSYKQTLRPPRRFWRLSNGGEKH